MNIPGHRFHTEIQEEKKYSSYMNMDYTAPQAYLTCECGYRTPTDTLESNAERRCTELEHLLESLVNALLESRINLNVRLISNSLQQP